MVERIYDTQQKLGIWSVVTEDGEEGDIDEMSPFLLDIHSRISMAYQAIAGGGLTEAGEDDLEAPYLFIQTAIELLGAAQVYGIDVGKVFVDMVVEQARAAASTSALDNNETGDGK
jgi:hypothetical protein